MVVKLTKQSTAPEIRAYFEGVLSLSQSDEEFPVNLDDVWPLVFSRKQEAVRALKNDKLFVENIDYQVLRKNAQNLEVFPKNGGNPQGGRPTETYMLTVPCLEFFIARKVRSVFEVYRKVFHNVVDGVYVQSRLSYNIGNTEELLTPLAYFQKMVMARYDKLVSDSECQEEIVGLRNACEQHYIKYRLSVANLPFIETVGNIEGRCALMDELGYAKKKS